MTWSSLNNMVDGPHPTTPHTSLPWYILTIPRNFRENPRNFHAVGVRIWITCVRYVGMHLNFLRLHIMLSSLSTEMSWPCIFNINMQTVVHIWGQMAIRTSPKNCLFDLKKKCIRIYASHDSRQKNGRRWPPTLHPKGQDVKNGWVFLLWTKLAFDKLFLVLCLPVFRYTSPPPSCLRLKKRKTFVVSVCLFFRNTNPPSA